MRDFLAFSGFPEPRANVTFTPLQFFTVALPHRSRGCVRIVSYMLRRILGWVDELGNPRHTQLEFSYRELIEEAKVSRGAIAGSLAEARKHNLIECVQTPRANVHGAEAQSAIYRLKWARTYTDNPAEFEGFFQGEAIEGKDGALARSARKNIPDLFFDHVVRVERLSVIRVVGVMLFRSMQWREGGERRVPVQISIGELKYQTHLGRRHVHEAVLEALKNGYLVQTRAGVFDPMAGRTSTAATYGIRWAGQPPLETVQNGVRSKKEHGETVHYGVREEAKKGYGEQAKKGHGISINRSINKPTTAATGGDSGRVAAAAGGFEVLKAAGFADEDAAVLARNHSEECITRQIAWLERRKVRNSRLGLLRRAIEGDWPEPKTDLVRGPAAEFVAHFEAALHGLETPVFESNGHGVQEARAMLGRLSADLELSDEEAARWGRRFGKFVAAKKPISRLFVSCARAFGPEFVKATTTARHRDQAQVQTEAKIAAQDQAQAALSKLQIESMREIQATKPELWQAFLADQERQAAQLGLSEVGKRALASETARASAFHEFLKEHQAAT